MSTIDINPADYLNNYSHWDMLVKYLKDNPYRFHYNTSFTREETVGLLMNMTAEAFKNVDMDDKSHPRNLLDRALIDLASGESLLIGRDNLLRLILALGINNLRSGEVSIPFKKQIISS